MVASLRLRSTLGKPDAVSFLGLMHINNDYNLLVDVEGKLAYNAAALSVSTGLQPTTPKNNNGMFLHLCLLSTSSCSSYTLSGTTTKYLANKKFNGI